MAAMMPKMHAGILTMRIWKMETSNPLALEMVMKETTAAAIGEQVMPICEAMEAIPQGRSGRIPCFREMSQMIGIMV